MFKPNEVSEKLSNFSQKHARLSVVIFTLVLFVVGSGAPLATGGS
ncbi:MAG: hypothetical protein AAF629_00980 [Chloroflexota bacterium]